MFSHLLIILTIILQDFTLINGQTTRSGLSFLPGGDMSGFRLPEDTKVGSAVYQLRASEPNIYHHHYGRSKVSFYISGDAFNVAKDSGIVTLIRPLDRETEKTLDVIITIVEENLPNKPESTLSIKRTIVIEDANDNSPKFEGSPYRYSVSESVKIFTTIIDGIKVTDADDGSNAQLEIKCDSIATPQACDTFQVHSSNPSSGNYVLTIALKGKPLDYETISSYVMTITATDKGGLTSSTNLTIDVSDVQDEPPKFLNAPYSITVNESLPTGTTVLTIFARDGDESPSIRRDISLELLSDFKSYFKLVRLKPDSWAMVVADNLMDREDPEVLLNGAIYPLVLCATELVGDSEHGAISYANITVVIQDINDQEPRFNLNYVHLSIPEDLKNGSAIPGLNLIVSDSDAGHNAKFILQLEDINSQHSVAEAFSVSPNMAMGRTPVIIKLVDSTRLDYEDESKRNFVFNVVALQERSKTTCKINLTLLDTNDNLPIFEKSEYHSRVYESQPSGQIFFTVKAHDKDSGSFGKVKYNLKGFGSEKFQINPENGDISVAKCPQSTYDSGNSPSSRECLDYETQSSYSLQIEAIDGGGKRGTASWHIELVDVNDNVPKFVRTNYVRELHEKDSQISPPLVLRAIDSDGPSQGGINGIRYRIKWTNLTSLAIDPISGEVSLTKSIEANFTRNPETGSRRKLNFEAIIEAIDGGQPPLSAEATIQLYVRSVRDGEPTFINEPYVATVKENALPGTVVLQVKATDPDGPDSRLRYSIVSGAKDSFVIDPQTGEIKVSQYGDLDRDLYGDYYSMLIAVTDSSVPNPLTSTAKVEIHVEDVNNKAPTFTNDAYVVYLSDKQLASDYELVRANASDPDLDAIIRYEIDLTKLKVHDKTGALVAKPSADHHFSQLLKIDPVTGSIRVNNTIDPERASIIVVPIVARDVNAPSNSFNSSDDQQQLAHSELTIYVQSHGERSPHFASPWTPSSSTYEISLPEETAIGSPIFTLSAKNPVTGKPITDFRKIDLTDVDNFFTITRSSGIITLNRRLDFEQLVVKQLKFSVEAYAEWLDEQTGQVESSSSVAHILVTVTDINDNSPIFLENFYQSSVLESSRWPQHVITVQATDKDSGRYGQIAFSLSGDGSSLFEINNRTGAIRVRHGAILDREIKSIYNLQVMALDNVDINENLSAFATGSKHPLEAIDNRSLTTSHRRAVVFVKITLLDVNDNPPKFSRESYEAIIPENLAIGTKIGSVQALDPDEGENSVIHYEISYLENFRNPRELLFRIDIDNGDIFVNESLSGKGRPEPYTLHIRAFDNGHPILSAVTKFVVFIGDVAANDGIPRFIKPAENEIVFVNENAKPGSVVYQVEAIDADNSNSPNGRVMYKFAEPSPYFDIDPVRGTIRVSRNVGRSVSLDREKTENFTLILIAFDLGSPPQESQKVMVIRLNDTDDNQPHFARSISEPPMVVSVDEELPIGTVITTIKAIDEDEGVNGAIVYQILKASPENFVSLESKDNIGYLKVNQSLDREKIDSIEMVVQASSPSKPRKLAAHEKLRVQYQATDLSHLKIKIKINDVDDNPPKFDKDHYVKAIRFDLPINSEVVTFSAKDPDPTDRDNQVEYELIQAEYTYNDRKYTNMSHVFDLNKASGVLRNDILLKSFVSGYFSLVVQAKGVIISGGNQYPSFGNSVSRSSRKNNMSTVNVKLFILRGSDLMKFVFSKSPTNVRESIDELRNKLENTMHSVAKLNWKIDFQEAYFYERKDGSLDFESSSACFQVFRVSEHGDHNEIVSYSEAIKPLKNSTKKVKKLYESFGITGVEECIKAKKSALLSKQEMGIVAVGLFIAFFSIILAIIASNMRKNFDRRMRNFYAGRSTITGKPITMSMASHENIYEWQDAIGPPLDAISARSVPILR